MKDFGLNVGASIGNVVHADRGRELRDLVTTMRREGLEPVPWFFDVAAGYINGQLTLDEFAQAIQCAKPISPA